MLNVAIATGGSGGHIFPAISIADELRRQFGEINIIFVGSRVGIEREVLSKYNYKLETISVRRFNRYLTLKNLLLPYFVLKSFLQAGKILNKYNCDFVIGCGGFASGIVILSAKYLGLPIFLQEQNSYPGLVTRKTAKISTRIFLGYEKAKEYLDFVNEKLIFSGNPIRKFEIMKKREALAYFSIKNKKTLFIYGGSQGSSPINGFISEILEDLLVNEIQIIWQTGERDYEEIKNKFGQKKLVLIKPFFHKMSYVYSASDLVVCRAGAISISEIAYFSLPAIIIPFPYAAGQHQKLNALQLKNKNAAIVMEEKNLDPSIFREKIIELLASTPKREKLCQNIKDFSVGNSSEIIVDEIKKRMEQR